MAHALDLAKRGWGRVHPNPLVGCVLLRDGEVHAEGWHAEFGGPHAEAAALAACEDAAGATCIVTLEPCAHQGKTPPCADALIDAGVTRVVAATRDPHEEGRGGAERLREAGIEVEFGLMEREAAALNAPFLWAAVRPDRPFVAVKVATSFDGFLADTEGRSQWLSGEEARAWVHELRAGFDAIGVGRVTAEADDPQLTVRGTVTPRVPPARVIFSTRGRIPTGLRMIQSARDVPVYLIVQTDAVEGVTEPVEGKGVTVIGADGAPAALRALREAGIRSLLVEGGGTLVGSLLEQGLVDRVYHVRAPRWLGDGRPAFGRRTGVGLGDAEPWTVTDRRALGEDTLVTVDRELCLQAS